MCFDLGYNNIASPWSNPTLPGNISNDQLTFELLDRNESGDLIVKIYVNDITQASPSKPQWVRTVRQFLGTPLDAFNPKIYWERSLEPDIKQYKIFRGQILYSGQDAEDYSYLGTTSDTFFVDNMILYRLSSGSGPCSKIPVKFSYRISSVDSTDKESVRSDRDSVSGYLDPCQGYEEDDSYVKEDESKGRYLKNELFQNYPNPFNPITKIRFSILNYGPAILRIFDITGKQISELLNERTLTGEYEIEFDASKLGLSSGIYFYRLESLGFTATKRMIIIK